MPNPKEPPISTPNRISSKPPALRFDRHELAGAFGELGTDLPLIVGMIIAARLDAASVLLMFGAMQILTGVVYRMPMPVQPLKAVALVIVLVPMTVWTLTLVFILGGIYVGIEETLEDALCAELVGEAHHGMAFGVLATVNGVGDFLSSIVVGVLWTVCGPAAAFGYSAVLFAVGAVLVLRLSRPRYFPSAPPHSR